jgi:hypothetical protein
MSECAKMSWEKVTEEKFRKMLVKMPLARGSRVVEEADLMQAMFTEVPMQFYSLMIRLLDQVGFDYKKYHLPNTKA